MSSSETDRKAHAEALTETRRGRPRRHRDLLPWQLGVVVALVAADQLTKALVVRSLALHETIAVIPGVFEITHVLNTGGVFGLGGELPGLVRLGIFLLLPITFVIFAAWYARLLPATATFQQLVLAALIGGSLGNLIDRVRLGVVVDFLLVHVTDDWSWPAFNVADCAITLAIIALLVSSAFERDPEAGAA